MAGKPSSFDLDTFLFSMKRASSIPEKEPFGTEGQSLGLACRPTRPQIGQRPFRGPNQHQHPPNFQNRNPPQFVRPSFTMNKPESQHCFDQQANTYGVFSSHQSSLDHQQGSQSFNDFRPVVNTKQNAQFQFESQGSPINRPQDSFKNQQGPSTNQQWNYRPQGLFTVRHPRDMNIRPQMNFHSQENNSVGPLITDQNSQKRGDRFRIHNQPVGLVRNDNMPNRQSFRPPGNATDSQRNQPLSGFGNAASETVHPRIGSFQQSTLPEMESPVESYQPNRSSRTPSNAGDFNNFKPGSNSEFLSTRQAEVNTGYLKSDTSLQRETEKSADQIWVDSWLQSLKKKEKWPPKRTVLTISNYKCCLQEAIRLRKELETLVSCVEEKTSLDLWETHMDNFNKVKANLVNLNEILSDEATLENIKNLVFKRKLKRERLKRQRVEDYKAQKDEFIEREQLHQVIDKIQNKLLEKSQQEKQNKEMKATADKILSEVRRKLSETNRMMEIITGLGKLRQLRCQSVYPNGMYLGMESDTDFSEQTNSLLTLLTDQKKIYEAEEKTLKVMLETEQEETKEREKEKARLFKEEKERREERLMNQRVFGKENKLAYDDPLIPHKQFYQQAETSLDSLVAIRQTWDMYLVGDHTPGSSVIPRNWVLPSEPSDDNWSSFLK